MPRSSPNLAYPSVYTLTNFRVNPETPARLCIPAGTHPLPLLSLGRTQNPTPIQRPQTYRVSRICCLISISHQHARFKKEVRKDCGDARDSVNSKSCTFGGVLCLGTEFRPPATRHRHRISTARHPAPASYFDRQPPGADTETPASVHHLKYAVPHRTRSAGGRRKGRLST